MSEGSAWAPFRNKAFRGLWLAAAVVNMAIWMQTVAAAWIMTTLTTSAAMVPKMLTIRAAIQYGTAR